MVAGDGGCGGEWWGEWAAGDECACGVDGAVGLEGGGVDLVDEVGAWGE